MKYLLSPSISSAEIYRGVKGYKDYLDSNTKELNNIILESEKFLEIGQRLTKARKHKNISKAEINKLVVEFHKIGNKLVKHEDIRIDLISIAINRMLAACLLGSKYPQDCPAVVKSAAGKYTWTYEGKGMNKKLYFYNNKADVTSEFAKNVIRYGDITRASGGECIKKREDILKLLPHKLDIRINLHHDKYKVMAAIKQELDRWYDLFKYMNLIKDERMPDRIIIKRYLDVYDLRLKYPHHTFKQIAEKLYPGAANKNLQSAIQQVKREYYKAKKIILGGYKDLKVTFKPLS